MANYINNPDFLKALIDYKEKCEEAQAAGKEDPIISNYIGECFLKIANHLSRKPNFASYSFRDEMVSDGIENCIMYFRNFDPTRGSNPFAYFTQIIYYAFLRRITKEKKQLYVKYKATQQYGILDEGEMYEDAEGNMKQFEMYENISEFIETFEDAKKKKKNLKSKGIEKFLIEDTVEVYPIEEIIEEVKELEDLDDREELE
jgi:hypothetical protein